MRKNAKRRSFSKKLLDACLTGVSRMALAAGDVVARNPVVAGGATVFLFILSFVASNAIWYQPQAHNDVFFKTRPEQVFRATEQNNSLAQRLTGAAPQEERVDKNSAVIVPVAKPVLPQTTVDGGDLPALAPNGDKDVAIMQYNLKQLGFYDGDVDGLTGPQTRRALEQWQAVQLKIEPAATKNTQAPITAPKADLTIAEAIAVAVPQMRPVSKAKPAAQNTEKTVEKVTAVAADKPVIQSSAGPVVSAEELIRIQAGLKAFGNDMVVVDGVPGKTTEDAIREFQKLFRLNVSGKPDGELIGKMREIGLIS